MHTTSVLHKQILSVTTLHATRAKVLMDAVDALTRGSRATITSLGRGLRGPSYEKHKIKRMDRLVGNAHLYQERHSLYGMLTRQILNGLAEPVIVIDWSPLCANQAWQLLRAAVPVGGRSLTLYEEVHPRSKLGNPNVQRQFLVHLAAMVPAGAEPIVVADSGFKTPFFRMIESEFGWHWVGRIRSRDLLRYPADRGWFSAKTLYARATRKARNFGEVSWTKSSRLPAWIVLIRGLKKQRTSLNLAGKQRRATSDRVHARREREPWLLVASQSLMDRSPAQVTRVYQTRMQIEEGFRDCKAAHYGLGLSQHHRMSQPRRAILCLLAALANYVLWCIGTAAKSGVMARQVRVNSSSERDPYSVIFLAKRLIAQAHFRLSEKAIKNATLQIQCYMETVLCE